MLLSKCLSRAARFFAFPMLFLSCSSFAAAQATLGSIERIEPEFDQLVPADSKIEIPRGWLYMDRRPSVDGRSSAVFGHSAQQHL